MFTPLHKKSYQLKFYKNQNRTVRHDEKSNIIEFAEIYFITVIHLPMTKKPSAKMKVEIMKSNDHHFETVKVFVQLPIMFESLNSKHVCQ